MKSLPVQRDGQTEVAYLSVAVRCYPDVARLQVTVNDTPTVSGRHPPTGFLGYLDCLLQGEPVVFAILYDSFYVAAAHELGDHVGLAVLFAQTEDCDYMGVEACPMA